MTDSGPLLESSLDPDPFLQLRRWLADGAALPLEEPMAAVLATADADGAPSARVVLLKDVVPEGITFFTNYESGKGRELAVNPSAALCVHWQPLRRQVRITGAVETADAATSDAYFGARPRGSKLGAWASPQSTVVDGRAVLDRLFRETERRFAGEERIPRPPYWGGYRFRPNGFEFWRHGDDRMHDRLRYRADGDAWVIERLAP